MVTKELIEKYHLGLCSPEEKKLVEDWLDSAVHQIDLTPEKDDDKIRQQIWQTLTPIISGDDQAQVVPLYKKLTKYAAVASIVLAVFFAGRLSVNMGYAHPVVDKTPKDHLFIFGGNGARGNLPGQAFKVQFDGRLKLYNGALTSKCIKVGNQEFVLEPYQTYYLSGSVEKPILLNSKQLPGNDFDLMSLKGDFSILRLDV